jgi:Tfp pilus assembly protein PilN
MAQINLAPGAQYVAAARQRRRALYIVIVVVALAAVAAWGGLAFLVQTSERQLEQATMELVAVEGEIARLISESQRITLFERRLVAVSNLLDQHISWGPLLGELEKLLPPPTVLRTLQVENKSDVVAVEGTTPDIDVIAQTLASLTTSANRPTLFSAAHIDSILRQPETDGTGQQTGAHYNFSASLTISE